MAALLRFFEINLGDKIFHCVFNGTFWCRNSPLLLHRTVILEISERLKAVRINNCFFCKKKLMAVLLRVFQINLGEKIFHCVFNWTFWCGNSPLLLNRTVILEISERLKAVRMNNCFFDCWISNKNPVARMHSKKKLIPSLNTTHSQLSLEKKIKCQKAFARILQLISSPSLMWTVLRGAL